MSRFASLVGPSAAIAAGLLLAAGVACYDVDSLRGGVRPGAEKDAAPPAPDATPPRFCETVDAALLCDDFDDPLDVPLDRKWQGLPPTIPGVLRDGNVRLERLAPGGAGPLSPPYVLDTVIDSASLVRSSAFVAQSLGVVGAKAVEISASIRAPELDAGPPAILDAGDGGTVERRGPAVSILGIGSVGIETIAATLELWPGALVLRSGVQTEDVSGTARAFVAESQYAPLVRASWLEVHIVIGHRDSVMARATEATGVAPQCPDTPAVAAAWGSIPRGATACITLSDRLVPFPERDVTALVSATMRERAYVHLLFDNVTVKALP